MTRNKDTTLVPVERITHSILVLRGHRVIIDRDLATIYGVETRTLNQAVKRNAERSPEDFRFQLNAEEAMASRSQSVIMKGGRGRNIKFLPYAFTEHDAIQAANVLNSPRAVTMGIHVVRAFVHRDAGVRSCNDTLRRSCRPDYGRCMIARPRILPKSTRTIVLIAQS